MTITLCSLEVQRYRLHKMNKANYDITSMKNNIYIYIYTKAASIEPDLEKVMHNKADDAVTVDK